jgi:hypothetical protein
MTAQDMLDYVFDQVDGPRRAGFEQAIQNDPALSSRITQLGRSVAYLVDDGDEIPVPRGLAAKTVATVQLRKSRPQVGDFLPSRVPFRLADFAVAATVFFAAILTLSVPLLRSRAQMDQAACSFNLGRLGVSLANYASVHGTYPVVPVSLPAGAYGAILQDAHVLHDPGILRCPSVAKSSPTSALPAYDKLTTLHPSNFSELFNGHFAYNVGYRDPRGNSVTSPGQLLARMPLASDGPPLNGQGRPSLEGNSPNHGGRGQGVLFYDGHYEFLRKRWISQKDRDLFLNEANAPAAGLTPDDSALMPSTLPVRLK